MKATAKHIPFLIALAIIVISCINVLLLNIQTIGTNVNYIIPNKLLLGLLGIIIVAFSIRLKSNIWVYLFTAVLLASYLSYIHISSFNFIVRILFIKIDFIALPLLVAHILLNENAFQRKMPSKQEVKEKSDEKLKHFLKKYENKTQQELLNMNENDLLPEAKEARNILLNKSSL